MNKEKRDDLFSYRERECAQCKKRFLMQSSEWVYRKYQQSYERVFCSWTCMRKWEKNHENRFVQRDRIIQALEDGLTVKEAAALLDEDPRRISYWKKKMEGDGENDGADY